jgi:hypothetical protein
MRVLILYHERGEHSGLVTDYVAEFKKYKRKQIELISLETAKGDDLAVLYGINQYPAVLVTADNGSMQRLWQGLPMPLMDELSYYTSQVEEHVLAHAARTLMPLRSMVATPIA